MEITDPIAGTLALRQSQAMEAVGTAVLGMALDNVQAQADTITTSLESLADPNVGNNIDVLV